MHRLRYDELRRELREARRRDLRAERPKRKERFWRGKPRRKD